MNDIIPRSILRRLHLSKSRFGGFKLVFYKTKEDVIQDIQNMDVEEKKEKEDIEKKDYNIDLDDGVLRNYALESLLRAKRTILDLALNNAFKYFCTFTFDRRKIDRNNVDTTKTHFLRSIFNYTKHIKNQNQNKQYKLQYIAVPEWHTNKQAIHFHCLMSELPDIHYSHTDRKTGHEINISPYFLERFGANQIIKIQDYNKFITYYITKYVTKGNLQIFEEEKNRYFRSIGLETSLILGNYDLAQLSANDISYLKDIILALTPDYESDIVKLYNVEDYSVVTKIMEINQKKDDE